MASSQYRSHTDRATGIRFVFKTDPDAPDLLHIYARHLTTPDIAIGTFFNGQPVWDDSRRRFQTQSSSHCLYWFWIDPGRVVMVVSCFRLEGD